MILRAVGFHHTSSVLYVVNENDYRMSGPAQPRDQPNLINIFLRHCLLIASSARYQVIMHHVDGLTKWQSLLRSLIRGTIVSRAKTCLTIYKAVVAIKNTK